MALVTANTYIEELKLYPRTFNALRRKGIETIGDLIQYTKEDLVKMPGLGDKTIDDVIYVLRRSGFALKRSNGYVKHQNEYDVLNQMVNELRLIVKRENKRHEMDMHLTPSTFALIEDEILPLMERAVDPEYDGDELGEPPLTMHEIHTAAHKEHIAMHS